MKFYSLSQLAYRKNTLFLLIFRHRKNRIETIIKTDLDAHLKTSFKKYEYLRLSNEMFFGCLLANFLGSLITQIIFRINVIDPSEPSLVFIKNMDMALSLMFFAVGGSILLVYEYPMRTCLKKILKDETPDPLLFETARRRILNEPYFIVLLNALIWFFGSLIFWIIGSPNAPFLGFACGTITVVLSFFWVEHVIQHNLIQYFFPNGGLSSVKGTRRIRISTRLFMLVCAGSVTPLFFIHINIIESKKWLESGTVPASLILSKLQTTIAVETVLFTFMAVFITFFISQNIKTPVQEIMTVLSRIRKGIFTERATIYSNDEIGYTGDVLNAVTRDLQEKEKMSRSLNLAQEVQQNLLPKKNMTVNGLEMAGKSIFCDQTGGDYYDFILPSDTAGQSLEAVVADVSGHGISSALLMASVRSCLRLRRRFKGSANEMISDVNHQICEDFGASGNFISLFYLSIHPSEHRLEWIRAGHDPGYLYDPETDRFERLEGEGLVLGLDRSYPYQINQKSGLKPGQIVTLFTDGVWETKNPEGESYGKERLKESIRTYAGKSCTGIIERLIEDINGFRSTDNAQDDLTLVVLKIKPFSD